MKRFAMLALLAALPAAVHAAEPNFANWVDFKAPDGSFGISLPGLPRAHDQKLIYGGGKIAAARTFSVSQMTAVYGVTVLDSRPSDGLSEADVAALGVSADGGETVSKEDAYVDGHLTRDVLLRRGRVWEKIHVVVVGPRAYRVSAMMREDYSKEPAVLRLFESFTLTK